MGGGASHLRNYRTYKTTVAGDDKWQAFLKKYDMDDKNGEEFFKVWRKLDINGTGDVNFGQFAKAWKIKKATDLMVAKRFFAYMDKDKDSDGNNYDGAEDLLHFQEWAVMTFDFCTLRQAGVVQWTFSMFDADRNGKLSAKEFISMAKETLGEVAGMEGTPENRNARMLFDLLDKNSDHKVTANEFCWAEVKAPEQLFGALNELRGKMIATINPNPKKKKNGGKEFWENAQAIRQTTGLTPFETYQRGGTYVRYSNKQLTDMMHDKEWKKHKEREKM